MPIKDLMKRKRIQWYGHDRKCVPFMAMIIPAKYQTQQLTLYCIYQGSSTISRINQAINRIACMNVT